MTSKLHRYAFAEILMDCEFSGIKTLELDGKWIYFKNKKGEVEGETWLEEVELQDGDEEEEDGSE